MDEKRINLWLENALRTESDLNIDVKQVVNDDLFQNAIKNARKKLGLTKYYTLKPKADYYDWHFDLSQWTFNAMTNNKYKDFSVEESLKIGHKHKDVVIAALKEANLHNGWYAFVEVYIATGKASKKQLPYSKMRMVVQNISEDRNSLIIRMDKGLTAEEYKKAWPMLKRFLNKPSNELPHADQLKNKIYLDSQNGLKPSQIAKKYFAHEYSKDPVATRDKVKKIISRFKRPL